MPASRIHEVIAKRINIDYNFNEELLRIGTISPDCWRNVPEEAGIKDKYLSHFWDFRVKEGQANNYEEFFIKYYDEINNPFYFGYLIHLIVDQYWKEKIDPRYVKKINDEVFLIDANGNYIKNENNLSYYEGIKMQQRLAARYNLVNLSINQSDYEGLYCSIDELNLKGLFNEGGSIHYTNERLYASSDVEESFIYDDKSIEESLNETTIFVKNELSRLYQLKKDNDTKIKIAIDIDGSVLFTIKNENNAEYSSINRDVSETLKELLNLGNIVDFISEKSLIEYASLKNRIVEHLENNNVKYNHIYLGCNSKMDFFLKYSYDILISDDLRNIESANELGIKAILYGTYNPEYAGYQTDNWKDIPALINKMLAKENRRKIKTII